MRMLAAAAAGLLLSLGLPGCSEPEPVAAPAHPGPFLMSEPVAETGTTSCPGPPPPSPVLASCERGRGTVHYVGPLGDGIVRLAIVGTWDATTARTDELAFQVTCGKGRSLAAEPCEGFEEVRVSGPSPLELDMAGFQTDLGDVLQVSLGEVDPMPAGLATAQRYSWEGVVEYIVEDPDAAHELR
jgi:hypothetical protein